LTCRCSTSPSSPHKSPTPKSDGPVPAVIYFHLGTVQVDSTRLAVAGNSAGGFLVAIHANPKPFFLGYELLDPAEFSGLPHPASASLVPSLPFSGSTPPHQACHQTHACSSHPPPIRHLSTTRRACMSLRSVMCSARSCGGLRMICSFCLMSC